MSRVATARAIHEANQKVVTDLVNKLKEARAAVKVSGDNLAKEIKLEEKAKIMKMMGPSKWVKPTKKVPVIKKTEKPGYVPTLRPR